MQIYSLRPAAYRRGRRWIVFIERRSRPINQDADSLFAAHVRRFVSSSVLLLLLLLLMMFSVSSRVFFYLFVVRASSTAAIKGRRRSIFHHLPISKYFQRLLHPILRRFLSSSWLLSTSNLVFLFFSTCPSFICVGR